MRCIILVFFFSLSLSFVNAQTGNNDFYERGKSFFDNGEFGKALQTWVDAYNTIRDPSLIDPRIGSAFIEIVARNKVSSLYEASTQIYYWSLSSTGKGEYEKYLVEEILKNEPIFDKFEFRDYGKILENNPQELAKIVLKKWVSLDPTPTTSANERLLEHWERIAYSKDNFTKSDNTIFGTDDRAMLYIKYGKPDLIRKGKLQHNQGDIYSSVATVVDPSENSVKELMDDIFEAHYSAEFEIWIYPFLSSEGRSVHIFGNKFTTRSFEKIDVITDFISNSAFIKSKSISKRGATYTPGYFLLHSYLKQLIAVDTYFSSQFNELNKALTFPAGNEVITTQTNTSIAWISSKVRSAAADMNRIIYNAPASESTYQKALDEIDVKVRDYRYYDEENKPIRFYVMNSYPLSRMMDYMVRQERKDISDYKLIHSVSLIDDNKDGIERLNNTPGLPFLTKEMAHPAQSIFEISSDFVDANLNFSVQLYDKLESETPTENLFPKSLLALGNFETAETENHKKSNELEFSDVMIGYQFEDENAGKEIPFLIAVDNKIPSFSNLFIHFQAINLLLNEENKSNLNLKLTVKEKEGGLRIFNKDQDNSVTINYQGNSSIIRESFEFELVDRKPGDYELIIEYKDVNSNITKSNKVSFELINID